MKGSRRKLAFIFIFSIFIIFLVLSGNKDYFQKESGSEITESIFLEGSDDFSAEEFTIISGKKDYPKFFKKIIFYPYEVVEGDEQKVSIWIQDPEGIEKAVAKISTDKGQIIKNLALEEGTEEEGMWSFSWHVSDISQSEYHSLVFIAKSSNGKETSFDSYIKNKEYGQY